MWNEVTCSRRSKKNTSGKSKYNGAMCFGPFDIKLKLLLCNCYLMLLLVMHFVLGYWIGFHSFWGFSVTIDQHFRNCSLNCVLLILEFSFNFFLSIESIKPLKSLYSLICWWNPYQYKQTGFKMQVMQS